MWSFFQAPPKTRFENLAELSNISLKILELRDKQKIFAAKPNADSIEFQKNTILINILNELDAKVAAFNQQAARATRAEELREAVALLNSMANCTQLKINNHRQLLMQHRHLVPSKSMLIFGIGPVVVVGAAAGVLLPAAGAVAATLVAGPATVSLTNRALRVDWAPKPATLVLLEELINMLRMSATNINSDLSLNSPQPLPAAAAVNQPALAQPNNLVAELTHEDCLCPILLTWMKDPVLCTLDNKHYERSAILRALYNDRRSPLTRASMPDDALPSSVLQEDADFKRSMQAFRAAHPQLEVDIRADLGEENPPPPAAAPVEESEEEQLIESEHEQEDEFAPAYR